MKLWTFAAFLLVLAAEPALGQAVGNPAAGYAVADGICADCHSIDAGESDSPVLDAPSFQMIADNPEISRLALTVFFQTPHPSMPNLIVQGDDARDLIAYILSLKP